MARCGRQCVRRRESLLLCARALSRTTQKTSPSRAALSESGCSSRADVAGPPSPVMLYSPTAPAAMVRHKLAAGARGGAGVGTR